MSPTAAARQQLRIITENLAIEDADSSITATLARGNHINRNQRYYSATVLQRAAVEATQRIADGKIIGLMNHPNFWNGEGDRGTPERTVIRWSRLWMDGADLKGEGSIVKTALGRDLLAMHEAKVHLGLSTNAKAKLHYEAAKNVPAPWDGDENDLIGVIDELELLTIDVVNDPSNEHARIAAESKQRRLEALRKDGNVNEELKAAQERIASLETELESRKAELEQLNAQIAEHTTELAREKRESIAREAIARNPHLTEALQAAVRLTALNAEGDEAAATAVAALVEGVPTGNGNNHIPDDTKTPDALQEAHAQIGVRA